MGCGDGVESARTSCGSVVLGVRAGALAIATDADGETCRESDSPPTIHVWTDPWVTPTASRVIPAELVLGSDGGDTGFDTEHPDLAGRTQLTRNYIDADEAAFRGDRHGTQVAGLIAAAANNGIGIVGVAPDVRLLGFKACWQPSADKSGRCNSFTLAQALADALAAKAHVINLSLVGPGDPLLEALVAKAVQAGVIVVGAVSPDPRFGFPARLPRVLPVAEAETASPDGGVLRAPARDIVTLVPDGHYDFASGSSLATAQVTGIVALLLARNQKLGAERLRDLLERSTRRHDTTRGPFFSVNACTALAQVVSGARCN